MKVLLLCDQGGISLQVLYCLEAIGAKVSIAGGSRARFLRFSRYCQRFHPVEFGLSDEDLARLAAWLGRYRDRHPSHVIIPGDELTTVALSRIKGRIAAPILPLLPFEQLVQFNNKWDFHRICTSLGIAVPATGLYADKTLLDPADLERAFGYPLVVKPVDQGNSNGVVIVSSAAALRRMVIDDPIYDFAPLLVQEFIPGRDIDLSLLAMDGTTICSAVQVRDGNAIEFLASASLSELGTRLVAGGRYHGLAHIDARQDRRDGSIKLIECNTRAWASIAAAAWSGLNFMAVGAALALGRRPEIRAIVPGTRFLSPTKLIAELARRGFCHDAVSPGSRQALKQAAADPWPWLHQEFQAGSRRLSRDKIWAWAGFRPAVG